MSEINQKFKGNVGVFLVCAELSRRNLIALPTSRNTKGYDIVVLKPETNVSVGMQVKCTDRKDFPVLTASWRNTDQAINDNILCPVLFVDISDWAQPRYYILSEAEMKRLLRNIIKEYSDRYQQRHGLTWEGVLRQEKEENRKPQQWAVRLDKIKDYANKWETLIDRLK